MLLHLAIFTFEGVQDKFAYSRIKVRIKLGCFRQDLTIRPGQPWTLDLLTSALRLQGWASVLSCIIFKDLGFFFCLIEVINYLTWSLFFFLIHWGKLVVHEHNAAYFNLYSQFNLIPPPFLGGVIVYIYFISD